MRSGCRLAALLSFALAPAAHAGWATLTEENNNLGADRDQYYVNGLNAAWLSPPLARTRSMAGRAVNAVLDALPWRCAPAADCDRRYEWIALGQQIYTPANKSLSAPDPKDRPYAGWLYTGVDLLQAGERHLDDLSLTLGVVGSYALGRPVQNGVHKLFGFGSANGWSHQLHNEPALTLGYARKWRLALGDAPPQDFGVDLVPELGATVGNVVVQAQTTLLLRAGWGLDASYGPRLLAPGLPGDGYFAPERSARHSGLEFFGGVQARVVGHDLFLDGNTFGGGPSVPRYPWIHEYVGGLSAYAWQRLRLDLSFVHQSPEFHGQDGGESYGSVTVSVRW